MSLGFSTRETLQYEPSRPGKKPKDILVRNNEYLFIHFLIRKGLAEKPKSLGKNCAFSLPSNKHRRKIIRAETQQ